MSSRRKIQGRHRMHQVECRKVRKTYPEMMTVWKAVKMIKTVYLGIQKILTGMKMVKTRRR